MDFKVSRDLYGLSGDLAYTVTALSGKKIEIEGFFLSHIDSGIVEEKIENVAAITSCFAEFVNDLYKLIPIEPKDGGGISRPEFFCLLLQFACEINVRGRCYENVGELEGVIKRLKDNRKNIKNFDDEAG